MGWITLAQAKTGASVTADSLAAAKSVITYLTGLGACFKTAHVHPINTIFSRDGISLKQEYDVESWEIRGLAQDLAEWLCRWRQEDTTVVWDMFGIAANGETFTAQATYGKNTGTATNLRYYVGESGNSKTTTTKYYRPYNVTTTGNTNGGIRVELENGRANDADGWRVTMTVTCFFCPDYTSTRSFNMAFIPAPPNEASNGVVVSTSKQKTLIAYDGTTPVYQNITTTVREFRYLNATDAATKVTSQASNASRTIDVRVLVSWGTGGSTYKNIQVRGGGSNGTTAATDKIPTSRPMGNGYYCVSVNEITYQVTTS